MGDFNPRNHLKKIKGKGDANAVDYLPPKWRVKWFREDHPDGSILTEIVHFDEKVAVVKCTITTPDGTMCVSHGHETAADHADYLMKAETKSIGRCLAIRGYGIEFSEDEDDKEEADPRDYRSLPAEDQERQPQQQQDTQWFKKGAKNGAAASDEMLDAPAPQIKDWFLRRLHALPDMSWPPEQKEANAKGLAVAIKKAGLSDKDRTAAYEYLTGSTSGKDMAEAELYLLQVNAGRVALLQRCAAANRAGKEGN